MHWMQCTHQIRIYFYAANGKKLKDFFLKVPHTNSEIWSKHILYYGPDPAAFSAGTALNAALGPMFPFPTSGNFWLLISQWGSPPVFLNATETHWEWQGIIFFKKKTIQSWIMNHMSSKKIFPLVHIETYKYCKLILLLKIKSGRRRKRQPFPIL